MNLSKIISLKSPNLGKLLVIKQTHVETFHILQIGQNLDDKTVKNQFLASFTPVDADVTSYKIQNIYVTCLSVSSTADAVCKENRLTLRHLLQLYCIVARPSEHDCSNTTYILY
jgi:hypothetical protein